MKKIKSLTIQNFEVTYMWMMLDSLQQNASIQSFGTLSRLRLRSVSMKTMCDVPLVEDLKKDMFKIVFIINTNIL